MPVDVSAPFPQLDLSENSVITVTIDDPAAVITQLVVHGWQDDPADQPAPIPEPAVLLAQQPDPAGAAA